MRAVDQSRRAARRRSPPAISATRFRLRDTTNFGEVAQAFNSMSWRLAEFAHEQERTQHQLVQLADQDPPPGLANRRRFHAELGKWVQHAVRYQRPVSLLFIDVDQCLGSSTTPGHAVGDRFLSEIAVSDRTQYARQSTLSVGSV